MGLLPATILAAWLRTPEASHSWDAMVPADAVIVPDDRCALCPLVGGTGHTGCKEITLVDATEPADSVRLMEHMLRAWQWLVHRIIEDFHGIPAADPGFVSLAQKTLRNFADSNTFKILSVDGTTMVLLAPPGRDPRNLHLFDYVEPSEDGFSLATGGYANGIIQPIVRILFQAPSVLATKAAPTIVAILDCDTTARTLTVRTDISCAYALHITQTDAADVYCQLFAEYGDPEQWVPIVPPAPAVRCAFAKLDPSKTMGNMHYPSGAAIDTHGKHWYCGQLAAQIVQQVQTGVTDEGVPIWEIRQTPDPPSRLADFPDTGLCNLTDCSHYQSIRIADAVLQPFGEAHQFERYFRQIWCRAGITYNHAEPPDTGFMVLQRGGPCLTAAPAGYDLSTATGIHAQIEQNKRGGYGVPYQTTDGDGNETAGVHYGAFVNESADVSAASVLDTGTFPGDGLFPTHNSAMKAQADPLGPNGALDDTSDPGQRRRKWMRQEGYRQHRDTGAEQGRGLQSFCRNEVVRVNCVIPRVSITNADAEQTRGWPELFYGFRRYATPVVLPTGLVAGGEVCIRPRRSPDKAPLALCTRVIHSIVNLGGGLFGADLENTVHTASREIGDPGDVHDVPYSWLAGGGPGFPAPDWAQINSTYESDGSLGSPAGGVQRGDSVAISHTWNEWDFSQFRMCIASAVPFGGDLASTWGDGYSAPDGGITLTTKYNDDARHRDRVTFYDESGILATALDAALAGFIGATITFWWHDATWSPVTPPVLKWTPWQVDDYQTFTDGALCLCHALGKVYVADAALNDVQAALVTADIAFACFWLAADLFSHLGRPAAALINDTALAIDACDSTPLTLPFSGATPQVNATLDHEDGYPEGAYICAGGLWALDPTYVAAHAPIRGLQRYNINNGAYTAAAGKMLAYVGDPTNPDLAPGLRGTDFLLLGTANEAGCVYQNSSPPSPPTYWHFQIGDIPYPLASFNPVDPATWVGGTLCGGVPQKADPYAVFLGGGETPWWRHIVADEGWVSIGPFYRTTEPAMPGGTALRMTSSSGLSAGIFGSGYGFRYDQLLSFSPDDMLITAARIGARFDTAPTRTDTALTITDIAGYNASNAGAAFVDTTGTLYVYWDGSNRHDSATPSGVLGALVASRIVTTSSENIGLCVLGRKYKTRPGTSVTLEQWDVVANSPLHSGATNAGKSVVYDITGLVAYVQTLRTASDYVDFALMASVIAADAMDLGSGHVNDMRDALKALRDTTSKTYASDGGGGWYVQTQNSVELNAVLPNIIPGYVSRKFGESECSRTLLSEWLPPWPPAAP